MTDKERLEAVIKWANKTPNQFALSLGFERSEILYRILRGENGISKNLSKKITTVYCNINESWLITGKGEMFIDDTNEIKFRKMPLSDKSENNCLNCQEKEKYIKLLEEFKNKLELDNKKLEKELELIRLELSKCLEDLSKRKAS